MRNLIPTEHEEQCNFIEFFRLKYKEIRIFAIPNGSYQSIRRASMSKKEGLSSGVPDLYIPAWKVWIEFKRQKGGTLSPTQKDWIKYLEGINDTVIIAYGFNDAVSKIESYLSSKSV